MIFNAAMFMLICGAFVLQCVIYLWWRDNPYCRHKTHIICIIVTGVMVVVPGYFLYIGG